MKIPVVCLALPLIAFSPLSAAEPNTLSADEKAAGWKLLFDGKSLEDWRVSENPGTFSVQDGELIVKGLRSHLFYVGPVQQHDFVNFEISLDIKTWPKANSGFYFHTRWQDHGWPDAGYEIQVNNSHSDPKRTAGLYGVKDNHEAVAADGEWFTMTVRVEGKRIVARINGRVITDYTEPADWNPPEKYRERKISRGTFALQGHDPGSVVHYRNIKVKVLP